MLLVILVIFAVAPAAPWIHRAAPRLSGWLLAVVPAGATVYLLAQIPEVAAGNAVTAAYPWAPGMGLTLSFYLDGLSLLFGLLITGIGALVVAYTGAYLKDHPRAGWFQAYILLFMGSMLGVVLSGNLLSLFVFWELTSLTSYLLIGFDHERAAARESAWQALLVTAAGGLALLAGLVLMGVVAGTYDLETLLASEDVFREHGLYVPILLLVLIGAFTKSAQWPFHFWLPNAMEAPTPASAYLHSSTMVKAGIYLLARFNPMLGGTDLWFWLLTGFGAATMALGACMALPQNYLKRLLAYTTISALGALTMLIGMGTELALKTAMVFLLVHALYKGALFLVAGSIDHETGEKDITRLGGLRAHLPITFAAAALAALSMAGIPPFFGFMGKELMYEAVTGDVAEGAILGGLALLTNILMVTVAGLLVLRPFLGARQSTPKELHEAPVAMWLGPALLGGLGLFIGLFPGFTAANLIAPAASALLAAPVEVELVLWHGVNLPLLLSVLTLAGGAAIYWLRDGLGRLTAPLAPLTNLGPERGYELTLAGVLGFSAWQTRTLQNGYLRRYMLITVLTTIILAGGTFVTRFAGLDSIVLSEVRFYEGVLAALILLSAVFAVWTSSRLAAVAAIGVVGYAMAIIFLIYGAPDLAMTQFVIETLTVILFVLVFYHLSRFAVYAGRATQFRDAVVAITIGVLMTVFAFVATQIQFHDSIHEFFAERSLPDAHGRNFVNVILVDFRSLDTLAEIAVLAVAGLGAYSLLRLRPKRKKGS